MVNAAISPDGQYALGVSQMGQVEIWNAVDGALLRTFEGGARMIISSALTWDQGLLVLGTRDGSLSVWDMNTPREVAVFHTDACITSCAVTPTGHRVVAGDALGRVHWFRFSREYRT